MKRGRYPSAARAKTRVLETRILALIWRRTYSQPQNRAPEGRAGRSQDAYRARSTGKRELANPMGPLTGCLLLPRDTVYQIFVR